MCIRDSPESFRVLKHELQALAIDVKMLDEDGNEVDISKEDNSEAAATPVSYTHLDVYKRQTIDSNGPTA